jgi:hypothetical protein
MTTGVLEERSWTRRPSRINGDRWERNPEWIALPPQGEVQGFTGVFGVFPGYNPLAFTLRGACTVDWGDGGAPENFADNVAAQHVYDYSAIDAGTTTSTGMRQVIVTVTMQANQMLYSINMSARHTASGAVIYNEGWLDLEIYAPKANIFVLGLTTPLKRQALMQRFKWVGTNRVITGSQLFRDCFRLQQVESMYTGHMTTCANMFQNCYSLRWGPELDTRLSRLFDNMFAGCNALEGVPLYSTDIGVSYITMFSGCSRLEYVPKFNLSSAVSLASMFLSCALLREIPKFDTSRNISFNSTFNGCRLMEPPLLDTSSGWDFSNMFLTNNGLTTVPQFDLSSAILTTSMFQSCTAVEEYPAIDFSRIVTATAMFNVNTSLRVLPATLDFSACVVATNLFVSCNSLAFVPDMTFTRLVQVSTMFNGCLGVRTVGSMDWSKVVTFVTPVLACAAMTRFGATGMRFGIDVSSRHLDAAGLDALYTNMGTFYGENASAVITVTNNPGTTGDDPTIATAKGFTVTGS